VTSDKNHLAIRAEEKLIATFPASASYSERIAEQQHYSADRQTTSYQ
jgi:hypothetical protein